MDNRFRFSPRRYHLVKHSEDAVKPAYEVPQWVSGKRRQITKEQLKNLLLAYFNVGDSYVYNLTRVKTAFDAGTMDLDDFEEFSDTDIEDIANYIWDRLS